MSQETRPPQEIIQSPTEVKPETAEVEPKPVEVMPKPAKPPQISLEELIFTLKHVQDDIDQICELTSEEKELVTAFFESFLSLMQPLTTTISVSTEVLPEEMGEVVQANVDPTGHLMIRFRNEKTELRDLSKESERDLMITVMKDVMPKFNQLTDAYRRKIEKRMKFLSSVTKEVQKISKAFSTVTSQ